MSLIGLLVASGSLTDVYRRSNNNKVSEKSDKKSMGLGFKLLDAFSLVKNMESIFQVNSKKGVSRLDCLDGMRALSMTWVILGHHFNGAHDYIDGRNKQYSDSLTGDGGGLAFEPIKHDFSVDTFLFIGATLLSFLLLKDLDKTNGWFNPSGPMRIVLFYLNRYLRITIPYGLAILVFAGIFPLVFTEPMGVASLVQIEGEECRKYWHRHLLYINTFSFHDENGNRKMDSCLGQTWYLAFDMQWFIVSPLVIYPLWLAKYGKAQTIAAVQYWSLLFFAFIAPMIAYVEDPIKWFQYHSNHLLPFFPIFAPWGQRSHPYLLGLMMGFILHSTKNKTIRIHWALNLFLWVTSFVLACCLVYGPYNLAEYPAVEVKCG